MTLDSKSLIQIKAISSSNKVLGKSISKVDKGVALFDKIKFYGQPETTDILFSIRTKSINQDEIMAYFGENYYRQIEGKVSVNFRMCVAGEEESSAECHTCFPSFYSVVSKTKHCIQCNLEADCLGGNQIDVDSGYWRESMESDKIYSCPRP